MEALRPPLHMLCPSTPSAYRKMRLRQSFRIEFLPIDFYKSDATKYLVEDGKIRLPFASIDGIGENAAVLIAIAAKKGGYLSKEDLQIDGGIPKGILETLTELHVLDFLPDSLQMSLF